MAIEQEIAEKTTVEERETVAMAAHFEVLPEYEEEMLKLLLNGTPPGTKGWIHRVSDSIEYERKPPQGSEVDGE